MFKLCALAAAAACVQIAAANTQFEFQIEGCAFVSNQDTAGVTKVEGCGFVITPGETNRGAMIGGGGAGDDDDSTSGDFVIPTIGTRESTTVATTVATTAAATAAATTTGASATFGPGTTNATTTAPPTTVPITTVTTTPAPITTACDVCRIAQDCTCVNPAWVVKDGKLVGQFNSNCTVNTCASTGNSNPGAGNTAVDVDSTTTDDNCLFSGSSTQEKCVCSAAGDLDKNGDDTTEKAQVCIKLNTNTTVPVDPTTPASTCKDDDYIIIIVIIIAVILIFVTCTSLYFCCKSEKNKKLSTN